ncbi:hypothetical protein QRX60_10210 [Amycolatopsis mongoliensis]|uniref:Uncharacterized protein n=1 Tax=Amycolatopsis mongoliensis TaxID=715475 RepID=A0A9Y2JWD8_9PSEU|nr:hypothetical protein [Amycolatopsis sp. 4-36]WIY04189.1 hypothetical protein QRX60_10210 [Amycolatopsis sp. 4-36]
MPQHRRISPVEYAVFQGEVYSAAGRVPADVQLYRDGTPWRLVPTADLDEWYTVRTYGTFLEHEFEIYSEGGGTYFIGVIGRGDGHWLAETWAKPEEHPEVQFQRTDQFTFEATVPKDMVTNLREERTDQLETEGNR